MALGRKSILTQVVIPNQANPTSPFIIGVQANKNHGICDLFLGHYTPKEVINPKTKKKKTIKVFVPDSRMDSILSYFQGRQYDSIYTQERLKNVLTEILNTEI